MRTRSSWILFIGLALASAHCDLGGRGKGPANSGPDGGEDAGITDGGADAGSDASWNDSDAGSWWQDGGVKVAACENDCQYLYRMDSGHYESASKSFFEITPGDTGFVDARDVSSAAYSNGFMNPNPTTCDNFYRISNAREMAASYTLTDDTHALVSGQALVYESLSFLSIQMTATSYSLCDEGGTGITKRYTFAYDAASEAFSYTVERDGRSWSRSIDTAQAPLVMFNLREYPLETFGNQSTLFAFLLGERYAWNVGGVQQIQVFSPEAERFESIAVEAVPGKDQLLVHYPVDTARAPSGQGNKLPVDDSANVVPVTYDQGIPTDMGARNGRSWGLTNGIPLELNMEGLGATTPASAPKPLGGYTTSQVTIPSGSVMLSGVVDRPDDSANHPVVVMLPGFDRMTRLGEVGALNFYAQLADRLAHDGFVVVRTDSRGSGASTGDLSAATVANLAGDAKAVVDALSSLPVAGADTAHVFLLTTGLGTHVAVKAASLPGGGVAGIVLVAPIARDYQTHAPALAEHFATNAGLAAGAVTDAGDQISQIVSSLADGSFAGDAYQGHTMASWQSLLGLDLVGDCTKSAAACTGLPPVLVVAGQQDHAVPPADATELEAALEGAGVDATLLAPTGLSHALTPGTALGLWPEHSSIEAIDGDAAGAIAGWLDDQSGGAI